MRTRLNKRKAGFTLLETIAATVFFGAAVAALMTFLSTTQKARIRIEARRQAAVAAHARCEMFASGLIYSSVVSTLVPNESQTIETPVDTTQPELPGGFAIMKLSDTITAGPAGSRSASIVVHYEVETAQSVNAQATATGVRTW